MARRGDVFERSLVRFDDDLAPTLEAFTFAGFRQTPMNNATLMGRLRYYHRLPDFDALLADPRVRTVLTDAGFGVPAGAAS